MSTRLPEQTGRESLGGNARSNGAKITMAVYSAFAIPTSGMMSQGYALNNIGNNIANLSTGGYKRTDTNFATVLSRTTFKQSDLGGVRPRDVNQISKQGNLVSSASDLDLAINGRGFFIFSDQFSGGTPLYGRDGSFQMRSVNDISVAGLGGGTITSKDGYLVDKNGYFLQGWTADADGNFTSKTLSALRIDQFAFKDYGTATTSGTLDLNLPATDTPGFGQVDTVQLGGTTEAGDTYSVTVNGTQVDFVVANTGDTLDVVRDGLVAAINANVTVAALVTASASPTTGALVLTGKNAGTTLTNSATVTDAGTIDTTATLSNTQTAIAGTAQFYNIEVVDANSKSRAARMDFTKTDTNTWKMEATVATSPIAQVGEVTIAGTVEAGDVYTVAINGTTVTYTVLGSEGNIDGVRDAMVTAINANTAISAAVTAAAGTAGKITLTSDTAGTAFTTVVNSTNQPSVAQSEKITIATGSSEAGDVYTTNVAGNVYAYTSVGPETETVIAAGLATLINADPAVSATSAAGVITINALVPGTPFAAAATVVTDFDAGGDAISATDSIVQANVVVGVADNTSTTTTTTANSASGTQSTTVTTIKFDENGKLISPASGSVSMTMNFPAQGSYAASSATMTLDISKITQFAGDFLPISYSQNGFAAADLRSVSFNGSGEVIANFDNSTNRAVYKIPLAVFSNPNALAASNGNVYEETDNSGNARVVAADDTGYATFLPNTHELSNVDLAGEFSRMIMTQTAYNSSATVFKTVDEMVGTARDLKR